MSERRWCAAAAAGWILLAAALHLLGREGTLGLPSSWSALASWYEAAGPATATMALARVGAMAGAAWLALATALQLAASVPVGRGLRRAADSVSPRWLRTLGRSMAGLSLSAGLAVPAVAPALDAVPSASAQQQDPGDGVAVMRPLPLAPTTSTTIAAPAAQPAVQPAVQPQPTPVAAPEPPPAAAAQPTEGWTVESGDSCWSVAAAVLEEALGASPDEAQIARYWLALVELNEERGTFTSGDPDLLYPGQELALPEPG